VRTSRLSNAGVPTARIAAARADASPAQFAIRERAEPSIHLAREDAPGAQGPAPTPMPAPSARPAGSTPAPAQRPMSPPTPIPTATTPAPTTTLAPTAIPAPAPTAIPAPAPAASPTRTPAPTSGASPRPAPDPIPGTYPTPGASPSSSASPTPNATPGASATAPRPAAGATPAGATGDFAARIQTAAATQRQAATAKANEVKGALATAFTGERQKLLAGFDQLIARTEATRDKALAELTTRAEAAKTRVRSAATAERAKLEQALARQQQALRQAGETVALAAVQQATAQGDRVQQGTASRAQRARTIGSQWATKFESLDGGASTASDIRSKANDLASKIEGGASEGRQTCLDHGKKIAIDIRQDAGDVANGMSVKLKDARSRIDKDRDDAIKSIDDGAQSARGGITQSFAQTRQQVEQKKGDAGAGYDQLRAGALAQVDTGLSQVLGKLDTAGQQMQTDVKGMVEGAKQYAVAPEVTAELNAGIGRTVAQYETKLGELGAHGTFAFLGVHTDANAAATQQTRTMLAGIDTAATSLQANLNGKIDHSAAKIDESATSAITDMQAIAPKVDGGLQHGVTKGQSEWNKQLTDKIGTLSGRVDSILSQQDSQLSTLDSDLGSQYADVKQRADDAKRDKPWYERAWDSVTSAVSAVFEFVGGLVVGFFEAAWELLKGLWEMLKTPLGWLLLAIVVILAVIVVVLFGWEALIIAGIIIGLCMAAYYIHLAVTTPGLSPYNRGKLFGKALFNVVLSFVGVEFEGSNLLRFTQWGGLIPQAIRLVQRVGSVGEAIQVTRLVGSIKTALQLVDALGSVERVMQLVEEIGSAQRLAALIDRVGSVEGLLRLIGNPKIGDVGTLVRVLENAKIGNVATLERLLANAKIADVAALERLLSNAKITDAAALERVLGNLKIVDVTTFERLLADAKVPDAATLERLLDHPKLADAAQFERLVAIVDSAARLERLLDATDTGTQLLDHLTKAGGAGSAAKLEDLLRLAGLGNAAKCQNLLDIAGGNTLRFQQLVTWAERLALRGPKPAYDAPPQVAAHGFPGANMAHFLDHTWEYLDLASRMGKQTTTFWPKGTTPSQISQYLGEALDHLNRPVVPGSPPPPRLPAPGSPLPAPTAGGPVQVGSQNSGAVGQFYPTNGETIVRSEMRAIGRVLSVLP